MRKLQALIVILSCYFHSFSQNLDSLKNVLDSIAKSENVVGMSVAIIEKGEISWFHQYGLKKEGVNEKIDSSTIFRCASISKPITALGVLKLHEEGKIHLDSNVNIYLKDWKLKMNRYTKDSIITIRRLLSHTGGINFHGGGEFDQTKDVPNIIEVLNGKAYSPKIKAKRIPGTQFKYSGGGYTILEKIIEDVSGQSFSEFMEVNILKPLEMNRSTFKHLYAKDSIKNVACGHWDDKTTLDDGWKLNSTIAAGGLWSTSGDLCKYIIEIQEILNGKSDGILKIETVREMLVPLIKSGDSNDWALGPYVRQESDGTWYFGHTGHNDGYHSILDASFTISQGGFVFLVNTEVPLSFYSRIYTPVFDFYGW